MKKILQLILVCFGVIFYGCKEEGSFKDKTVSDDLQIPLLDVKYESETLKEVVIVPNDTIALKIAKIVLKQIMKEDLDSNYTFIVYQDSVLWKIEGASKTDDFGGAVDVKIRKKDGKFIEFKLGE